MVSDEVLLCAAASGDKDSLNQLLEHFRPKIHRRLRLRIDSRWRSVLSEEDVIQQTFLDAFQSIRQFRPRGIDAFESWLINIARRNLIDAVRELQASKRGGVRKVAHVVIGSNDQSYLDLFERIAVTITSPSQAAIAAESKTALQEALNRIPKLYSDPIRLYDLAGMSAPEAAGACDCSAGTMHMRRCRGLAMLKNALRTGSHLDD